MILIMIFIIKNINIFKTGITDSVAYWETIHHYMLIYVKFSFELRDLALYGWIKLSLLQNKFLIKLWYLQWLRWWWLTHPQSGLLVTSKWLATVAKLWAWTLCRRKSIQAQNWQFQTNNFIIEIFTKKIQWLLLW